MSSMPGARCNRQCSYMSRQCSSLSPGAVTCKLVSAPRPRLEDRGFHISIYKSFWCSNDVSGGQSKIVLRRLQQEWFLSLDVDICREGRCKLSNAAAGQPVTQQPRGVYPYRRETVISVCGFSFMASSLTTKFGERDGILEIPGMPSMPGARCNRQCSYMSRQCSSQCHQALPPAS